MGSIAFAAAVAAVFAQSAAFAESAPLEPSGPWTVEVSEGICLVGRTYGEGNEQVTMGFRQLPNAEDLEIGLWVSDPSEEGSHGTARLRLDQHEPIEADYMKGPVAIKGMHLVWIATTRSQLAALPAAKSMDVTVGSYHTNFNLRNVAGALKALADCERDLLVKWGMDPAVLASIATSPSGELAKFFSTSDYPTDAIRMRKEGTAGVRFWVNTDGKLSDCRVVASSGSPHLDSRTCGILTRRARAEPAKTKDGRPVASISFVRVQWFLPRR